MMVLRHIGPPSTAVPPHDDISPDNDRPPIPIDLSNKHHRSSSSPDLPRHHLTRNPFLSIIPPTIRPLSSPRTPPYLINNNNNEIKCNSPHSINSEESSPRGSDPWRFRRKNPTKCNRWKDTIVPGRTEDELNSSSHHSSPDSGLHRDSPGEEEEILTSHSGGTPPLSLRKQSQSLIPLSIIRERYTHKQDGQEEEQIISQKKNGKKAPDKVLTKRARLEEMVTHIKSSKDRSRRNSGDDDTTSSGGHATSSDEILDDGNHHECLNLKRKPLLPEDQDMMEDEPCNLVCNDSRLRNKDEDLHFRSWKSNNHTNNNNPSPPKLGDSPSPTDTAKLLGMDPETYQQQMMQLQLTSAAMLGDPGALLKGMGQYPPWVYLNYYSQILQSFQAQEILRQYALQSNPLTPNLSQRDRSPSISKTLNSSRYNCQSPLSPASLSEGPIGADSDGSTVGQSTPGSANNGKRAPRAMTGRHVRTGTGASPSTLQTLRQKIEERQRIKAQQARNEMLNQPNSKLKNSNNTKFTKTSSKSTTIKK